MSLQLGMQVHDCKGTAIGEISRLIANQSDRTIHAAVVHLTHGKEVVIEAGCFSVHEGVANLPSMTVDDVSALPELDIRRYYALHPVEWQEEWGAVKGEILTLYPPGDTDGRARRRFIAGSLVIMGGIIASLLYPISRYLLYPLSKAMPRLWIRLKSVNLETDQPVFVPYKVHRVEGYLEETIPKGVWLVRPSPALARRISRRKENLEFPSAGWANEPGAVIAFSPKCPHLGCNVHWSNEDQAFLCPCHTSRFALDGHVIGGPAPRPLDTLPVRITDGNIEIMDMEFRAGTPDKIRIA
ncbi:MAG: ubiquinol-cytochrome c reductase iron-sulfur subunit [Deltaproteobacteria bacterium]|nr:MAG: ubiquinol-cytochrome c reductase iron-sulfur subunit [Deltaproteobacteria bacterium]